MPRKKTAAPDLHEAILNPMAKLMDFQALKYHIGKQLTCGCGCILDCLNAVELTVTGETTRNIVLCKVWCGLCANKFDISHAIREGIKVAGESLCVEIVDGRCYTEDESTKIEWSLGNKEVTIRRAMRQGMQLGPGRELVIPSMPWVKASVTYEQDPTVCYVIEQTTGRSMGMANDYRLAIGSAIGALRRFEREEYLEKIDAQK